MDFNILGEMKVLADGRALCTGGPREQRILAILLVNANLVVSVDQLIDAVWDEGPPATSRSQIRNRISHLRRSWASTGNVIATEGCGYRIRVTGAELDAARFETAVEAGAKAMWACDPATAARLMRQGLAQWRGPSLSGVDGEVVRAAAKRLDSRRLTVLEDCFGCELELGRHNQILDEIAALAAEQPFRERLVHHLMSALYRSGRRADALAVYRETTTLFRDELGVDPGAELQSLHEAVLRDHQMAGSARSLVPAQPSPVINPRPAQLPADIVDFTGRANELRRLDRALPGNTAAHPTAVPILAITGAAGLGKTALAIRWAHRAARYFPDGQMFLDLRGNTSRPLAPAQALAALLRSLGVPAGQVPMDVDDAGRMFRSLLSGKRILLLVDNVYATEQIPPLLPGGAGCVVVLTSRDRLVGLAASNGAHLLPLDVLADWEARDLLAKVGGENVADDPLATAELAHICAYVPRALRNAAAHVCSHSPLTIRDYVDAQRVSHRLSVLHKHPSLITER
jgi:DNA-binding SARP family transcriptional activator